MRYSSRQSARVIASTAPLSMADSSAAQRGSWNTNRSRQTLVSRMMRFGGTGIMWALFLYVDLESYADSAFACKKSRPRDATDHQAAHHAGLSRPLRTTDLSPAHVLAGRHRRVDGLVRRTVDAQRDALCVVDARHQRGAPGGDGLQRRRLHRPGGTYADGQAARLHAVARAHPVRPVRHAAAAGPDPPAPARDGHAPGQPARQGFVRVLR